MIHDTVAKMTQVNSLNKNYKINCQYVLKKWQYYNFLTVRDESNYREQCKRIARMMSMNENDGAMT